MQSVHGVAAKDQPIRKVSRNRNILKTRHVRPIRITLRFETAQNRKRTIVTKQTIVQNKFAGSRVKKVRDRMTMKIDHKSTRLPRDSFPAESAPLLVAKVMREQRADHIVKAPSGNGN